MTSRYGYRERMGRGVRLAAVVVVCLGLAACEKTTGGSVAMTTEPGGPITTSSPTTTTSRARAFPPTPTTSTSAVPAPPGATTMKCSEFTKLDDAGQLAVVKEILDQSPSAFSPLGDEFAQSMANTMCGFLPDQTVYEVLTGSTPP
jgi:hypothetical protein